jgi:filamentous hemagglutinin family protein
MIFKKAKSAQVSLLLVLVIPAFAFALPEGENVVSGSASFDRSQTSTLSVNTPSERLIVNYNSFNIAQPEAVRFQQPSSSAIVLNRVVGVGPSSIMGTMAANGRIFVVNPNGVIFGPNSHVDVAGMVASSLEISNDDFLKDNFVFSKGVKNGYVINQGTIKALSGGYVCLLGGAVDNQLAIQADLGTVALASGEKITLALENNSVISVVVNEAVQSEVFGPDGNKMASAIKNSGTILAEGGKAILTARVLNKVFDYAINNTGLIKVTSLVKHDGVIELMAEGAPVVNSGTLEAETVYIKVSNAGITNAPEGKIIAQVSPTALTGGKIFLEAATILQQGSISANVEQGTAGQIDMISDNNIVLDENSRTEARAAGISGNGGKININSKQGSVFVNKNAKIDFSAGSVAGNGGRLRVDAFAQLGFYGILNGRAPPGFTPGIALLDPEYATIGTPEGTTYIEADTTIDAWRDITIIGNITIGYNNTLNLFADHQDSETWDTTYNPGIGAIINTGDFIISGDDGGGTLNLRAGSAIGSIDRMIWTNVRTLSAVINPNSAEGDILIEQDFTELEIADIRSPGLVVLISSGRVMNGAEGTSIRADELYIESDGGIGAYYGDGIYSWLDISVNNLSVWNEGSGDIFIRNDKDLTVLAAVNTAYDGAIGIEADGALRVRYGISTGDNITLYAQDDIIISTLADLIAWGEGSSVYLTSENGAITRRNMEVLDYGMLAYWNFDQSYAYYYAQDVSGNGYSAYCGGTPEIVEGMYGQALYFDGVNDYINIGRNFGFGSGPFTLIAWYQGTQSLNNVGLMGASPSPYTTGYALETQYGALQSWVNNNMSQSAIPVNDGYWHQLAMVRDGAEGSLYVFNNNDFHYATDFSTSSGSVDTAANFWIGGWGHMKRLTQGALDDVRVYAAALSGLEIYSQTLLAPGTGEISAGEVVLSAANGIDVAMSGVGTVTATNSATGDINITNTGDLQVGNVGSYEDGIYNHGGDIDLQTTGSLYIVNDIYTDAPGGSIDLYAGDDIVITNDLGNGVTVSSGVGSHQQEPVSSFTTGSITLYAGRDILMDYGNVYAGVWISGVDNGYASAGSVSLTAGRDIQMDQSFVYSDAYVSANISSTAYSGDVSLYAGNNVVINGFNGGRGLVYSSASASGYEGNNQTALAQSGAVSITAGNALTIDGRDPEYHYGADIVSYAYAYSDFIAEAYSSSVVLSTSAGDISLWLVNVDSYAQAQVSGDALPGSSIEAIAGEYYYDSNNYENGYLAVMIDAGDSILMNSGAEAFGYAVAQGDADTAFAQSGDITLDAWYDITLADRYLHSDASTDAVNRAESISGKLTVASYYGLITVPAAIESTTTAIVNSNGGSAYATSDNVDVHSWYGPVTVNSTSISSYAEAYGGGYGEFSPGLVQATSGDVSIYAGGDLTLNAGSAYSYPHTSSQNAVTARLTAGNVNLAGNNIYLTNSDVYCEVEATALYAYATSGGINIYASGILDSNSEIYSDAAAYGSNYAYAVSGPIDIESGSLDINNNIYTSAYASSESEAYAYSGSVDIWAYGNLAINESSVYSSATAGSSYNVEAESGDISISAYGSFTGTAGSIYSAAGQSGEGTATYVTMTAGDIDLYSGSNMDLIDNSVESTATANADEYAYAQTGNIDISCSGIFSLLGSSDLISRAQAYASGGESPQAYAYTGDVSVLGYYGIEAAGDLENEATVSFLSWATAEGSDDAYAQSADVNLESTAGEILLSAAYISSQAEAFAGEGGDTATAYSGSVSLTAEYDIDADGVSPNTRASASGGYTSIAQCLDPDTEEISLITIQSNDVDFFNEGSSIYSTATVTQANSGTAQSADITVICNYGDLALENGVSTNASVTASNSASATSGNINVQAPVTEVSYISSISSTADATAGFLASAYSGQVSAVFDSISLYESSIYSEASAVVNYGAGYSYAYSGDVNLAVYGALALDFSDVYSRAFVSSYGGYADAQSGNVYVDADYTLAMNASRIYSESAADNAASFGDLYLSAGYVEVLAGLDVTLTDSIIGNRVSGPANTRTINAYCADVDVEADGSISLISSVGANYTAGIYSSAVVNASDSSGATAGDVTVYAEGNIMLNGDVYSLAYITTGGNAYALSGDVGVSAGGVIEIAGLYENPSAVYSLATAVSFNGESTVYAESGELGLDAGGEGISISDESSVYTSAEAVGGWITEAISGDVGLFTNGSIDFGSGHVYTMATAGASYVGGDVSASNSATATSGEIVVSAIGDFILDLVSGLNSTAYAYGIDTAAATSGPLGITVGGDFSVLSDSEVYSMAQAIGLGAVAPSASAAAEAGALTVYAGGDILIDVGGFEIPPVRSEAIAYNAESISETFGDLILAANGDLTLSNDLMGNTINLLADYDNSGAGELIFDGEYFHLIGFSHSFQGANDFVVTEGADGSFYLSLDDGWSTLELYTPDENVSPSSISINSTLEETLTVNELQPRSDYIYLYSAGDLYLNGDLQAGTIRLIADNNNNGSGNLYSNAEGDVSLTAEYFSFQSASDFILNGENLLCGSLDGPAFSSVLYSDDDGLEGISVRSTAGNIFVENPESELEYSNVEMLDAAQDIFLNAGISGSDSGLYIHAGGSIFAGDIEGPHITSSGDVYIYGGTYSYTGEYPDYQIVYSQTGIGSVDSPLDVLITGEGSLNLAAYGLVDGVSAAFTGIIREETTPDAINVYIAPGIVYFNNIPSDHPEPEPTPESPVAPVGSIMANQPNAVNAADLATFQFSSSIGSVFFYHPLSETDMGAFDQFSVGADAYELSDGQLKLVGHDGLLQFFQEFDQKLKQE